MWAGWDLWWSPSRSSCWWLPPGLPSLSRACTACRGPAPASPWWECGSQEFLDEDEDKHNRIYSFFGFCSGKPNWSTRGFHQPYVEDVERDTSDVKTTKTRSVNGVYSFFTHVGVEVVQSGGITTPLRLGGRGKAVYCDLFTWRPDVIVRFKWLSKINLYWQIL